MPLSWSFVQMHIVSKRKDLTLDEALQAPDGLAMLGVFIEVKPGEVKLLTVLYAILVVKHLAYDTHSMYFKES